MNNQARIRKQKKRENRIRIGKHNKNIRNLKRKKAEEIEKSAKVMTKKVDINNNSIETGSVLEQPNS